MSCDSLCWAVDPGGGGGGAEGGRGADELIVYHIQVYIFQAEDLPTISPAQIVNHVVQSIEGSHSKSYTLLSWHITYDGTIFVTIQREPYKCHPVAILPLGCLTIGNILAWKKSLGIGYIFCKSALWYIISWRHEDILEIVQRDVPAVRQEYAA